MSHPQNDIYLEEQYMRFQDCPLSEKGVIIDELREAGFDEQADTLREELDTLVLKMDEMGLDDSTF